MRRLVGALFGCVVVAMLVSVPAAQQPPAAAAYGARCATCHGPSMTGGSGPSILTYIRYHTDAEVTATVRDKHASLQIPEAELRQILADVRVLAGTNAAMATGGYTGRRGITGPLSAQPQAGAAAAGRGAGGGGRGGAGRGPGAAAPDAEPPAVRGGAAGRGGAGRGGAPADAAAAPSGAGLSAAVPTTIKMADGRTRTGVLLGQGDLDATLLENGKYVLLSRDGDVYREKVITPKADWLHYDGSLTGNRFSQLEQINTATIKRVGPVWMFPTPNSPRLEVTPTVADGIMYVSGWNEWFALDATTGRQLWTYSEPRHEGMLSEGGSGAARGVTISGDKAIVVTDHAHIVGLNRFTGQRLWDVEMGSYLESYSATSPPLPVGDL